MTFLLWEQIEEWTYLLTFFRCLVFIIAASLGSKVTFLPVITADITGHSKFNSVTQVSWAVTQISWHVLVSSTFCFTVYLSRIFMNIFSAITSLSKCFKVFRNWFRHAKSQNSSASLRKFFTWISIIFPQVFTVCIFCVFIYVSKSTLFIYVYINCQSWNFRNITCFLQSVPGTNRLNSANMTVFGQ